MAITEFLLHLFGGRHGSLHPRVSDNISHRQSLARDQLEHAGEQIAEFLVEATLAVTRVRAPENVRTVSRDELVEAILGYSLAERRMSGHHDEQNDTDGEEID